MKKLNDKISDFKNQDNKTNKIIAIAYLHLYFFLYVCGFASSF